MREDHLKKAVLIHVCKDKTLSYRTRNQKVFNGVALPVYSVNSQHEAEQLILTVGSKQYAEHPQIPRRPWYKLSTGQFIFKRYLELDDLDEVTKVLDERYKMLFGENV